MDGQADILGTLQRLHLIAPGETAVLEPLTGGVASDIYKVTAGSRVFAVKRALEKLRVAAEWHVTTDRNRYEAGWLRAADRVVPGCAPHVLAHDAASGLFAMDYLDPGDHPVWKAELRAGRADPAFAAEIGRRIGAIHAATAHDRTVAGAFDTIDIFRPIRLEAYLEAAAARHPGVAGRLIELSHTTAVQRIALVHGDVSPKNILVGPGGPVFLDAECAWYGDPAFDLAFCLNHLLLKCLWVPAARDGFLACFDAMTAAYLAVCEWEAPAGLEARAAALLPGLLLARVDGKSPVEYITDEGARDLVRRVALARLALPAPRLSAIRADWAKELQRG